MMSIITKNATGRHTVEGLRKGVYIVVMIMCITGDLYMRMPRINISLPEKRYRQFKELSKTEQKSLSRMGSEWIEQELKRIEKESREIAAQTGKVQATITSKNTPTRVINNDTDDSKE